MYWPVNLIRTFIEHKFIDKNHLNVLIITTTSIAMILLRVNRLNENNKKNKWTIIPIITSLILKILKRILTLRKLLIMAYYPFSTKRRTVFVQNLNVVLWEKIKRSGGALEILLNEKSTLCHNFTTQSFKLKNIDGFSCLLRFNDQNEPNSSLAVGRNPSAASSVGTTGRMIKRLCTCKR